MITIDRSRCIGDGLCIKTCPMRDFRFDEEQKAVLVPPERFVCIACGHCVSVCPTNAISMQGDASVPIPAEEPLTALESLERTMKTRRSIRWYQQKALPREVVQRALEVTRHAPTAKNLQQIEWVVIDNPDVLRQVGEATARLMLTDPAAAVAGQLYLEGHDTIVRGAPCLILAHAPEGGLAAQDCAAAVSYLELILHGAGVGSCWAGYVIRACAALPELKSLLGLGAGRAVFAGLMAGYSAERFRRIPGRAPVRIAWL